MWVGGEVEWTGGAVVEKDGDCDGSFREAEG